MVKVMTKEWKLTSFSGFSSHVISHSGRCKRVRISQLIHEWRDSAISVVYVKRTHYLVAKSNPIVNACKVEKVVRNGQFARCGASGAGSPDHLAIRILVVTKQNS